ncbi:MAG: PAS domain-containing protein, partial [Mariniblastus sp.]
MEPIDEIDLRYKTLHAIHESAADAIFSVNELGVVNTVNPAAECLFGYGKTELVGQDIFVLIPSLSCEQTERGLARVDELRAVAAGTGLELTALNKEGSSLFVDVTVREMRTDGEQSFAVFVRERAHSQYAGEQTESLGRIIEESFNETYILDALDLKFVFVNLAARNNLGYSSSELAEMTPVDINPSFSMDAFQELVKPLLQGATESLQFETEHVRKNGSPYEVMVN